MNHRKELFRSLWVVPPRRVEEGIDADPFLKEFNRPKQKGRSLSIIKP